MKITREVNGVLMEFELSREELSIAHNEQEHLLDVEFIQHRFKFDKQLSALGEEEYEKACDAIAYSFHEKKMHDFELGYDYEAAREAIDEYFENYEFDNVWITVYKDALGCPGHKDNLTEVLVPVAWLKSVLAQDGITDLEVWLDEYTADSTDDIARLALDEGVVLKCNNEDIHMALGLDKGNKTVESLIAEASERSEELGSGAECKDKEDVDYGK
ncbi:MAG: hypothetical protein IKW34_01540 [Clostridia bacterium]|nr:hypothetical protein [Clostridia bacterium]